MSALLARTAYETLEPYHVLSYFNPHNADAAKGLGVSELGLYFGGRGAPLGRCPAAVVTATFFNFNPAYVNHGWTEALSVGLDAVEQARNEALDASFRGALGDAIESPELIAIVDALRAGIMDASYVGRPLAAAWAAAAWPTAPHLQLWHALSVAREHRGDGHVAALTLSGLGPVEALVLHEAPQQREIRRRTLGKKTTLITRGWTEQDWDTAQDSLRSRGLLDGEGVVTEAGAQLYDRMEQQTDAAAARFWAGVPDAEATLTAARPFVKAVIDSGYLPGTRSKS